MLKTPVLCVLCISRSVRKCVYTTFVTLDTIVNGLCVQGEGKLLILHHFNYCSCKYVACITYLHVKHRYKLHKCKITGEALSKAVTEVPKLVMFITWHSHLEIN